MNVKKKTFRAFLVLLCFVLILLLGGSLYYRILPHQLAKEGLRIIAVNLVAIWHKEDIQAANSLQKDYWIGPKNYVQTSSLESWEKAKNTISGFTIIGSSQTGQKVNDIPFVYEKMNAPQLIELLNRYHLDKVIEGASSEYDAMLRLGKWLGTRFDHGMDKVPGGNDAFRVADVLDAGKNGSKFWCEIAAKVSVQAASAMGWPARLVSTSQDGYEYQHAVAEIWSNQFNKWFVMDADFNFVFESDGIPLSAFELTHQGPELQKAGRLHVRRIAPPKPSINSVDLLPYFRYIHIDLRNDWYTRRLSCGSPAGGDFATWWTARSALGPLLTAKIRIDDEARFNWPMNTTSIHLKDIKPAPSGYVLDVALTGYSPYFSAFLIALDDRPWERVGHYAHSFHVSKGTHAIHARMLTKVGDKGAENNVTFKLP